MADKNIYWSKTALTGGAAGALDSIDGTGLQDGEIAFVFVSGVLYTYRLDVDSAAAESSPSIIAPDTNAGDKRWILHTCVPVPQATGFTLSGGVTPKTLTVTGDATISTTPATAAQGAKADTALQNIVEDVTPQLGGNLDANKKAMLMNATLDDHEYEGLAVTGVAGENLAQGNVVYKKLNGGAWKWYKYDCNGTDKLILPRGIATAAINSGDSGVILVDGQMRDDTWSLSPSADTAVTVYASATAGGLTLTAPSTAGDEVVVVGFLVGGNTIQTAFGYAWIEK